MGVRMNVSLCYGIQLTREEKKRFNSNKMEEDFVNYYRNLYSNGAGKLDLVDVSESFHVYKMMKNKEEFDKNEIIKLFYNKVMYPDKFNKSKSVLGYESERYYGKSIFYPIFYSLLEPRLKTYKITEFKLPINDELNSDKYIIEQDNKGNKMYLPHPNYLTSLDFIKFYKISNPNTKIYEAFNSVEEVIDFVNDLFIKLTPEGSRFRLGLKYVNLLYPDKTIKDINRYIVVKWN